MALAMARAALSAVKEKGLVGALRAAKQEGYLYGLIDGNFGWVVYKDTTYNASSIPPEWHGWLHHITDRTAEELEGLRPSRYGIEHRKNRTGEGEQYIYHSKGHALNPNKRDWKRYEQWIPAE